MLQQQPTVIYVMENVAWMQVIFHPGEHEKQQRHARLHTCMHGATVVLMSPNTLQISNVSTRRERGEHVVSLSEQEVLPDIWVHLVTSLENIDRNKNTLT